MDKKKKEKKSAASDTGAPKPKGTPPIAVATVFFSGMSVMALELGASRLYAPFFGSTIHVWTGLIGSLLFFMAVGNLIGGSLSRRGAGLGMVYRIVIVASAVGAIAPFLARPVMIFCSQRAGIGGNMLPGIIATTTVALAVPLTLFGCVLPLATGALTSDASDAGSKAGLLYSISTTGSILGVFLPTLVTLPSLGTRMTFIVFSALSAACAAVGLGRNVFLIFLAVFIPARLLSDSVAIKPPPDGEKRVVETETLYNYVNITKRGKQVKMLVDNGWYMYSSYTPGETFSGSYRDFFPLAKFLSADKKFPAKICVLGVAGGTDARVLKRIFPDSHITGVEIDPELVSLGRSHMGLGDSIDRLVVADGRAFITATDEQYDLIIVDVYNQAYIPFHMATSEFFKKVASRLAPGGVMAMNVAWRSRDEWSFQKICADTIAGAFKTVFIHRVRTSSNALVFGLTGDMEESDAEARRAEADNENLRTLANMEGLLLSKYEKDPKGFVMTDDLAPVEYFTDMTVENLFRPGI